MLLTTGLDANYDASPPTTLIRQEWFKMLGGIDGWLEGRMLHIWMEVVWMDRRVVAFFDSWMEASLLLCSIWVCSVGTNMLLTLNKLDGPAFLGILLLLFSKAWLVSLLKLPHRLPSQRWSRRPVRSWPLARARSHCGGKVKVRLTADMHLKLHLISCCKASRQALALSLHPLQDPVHRSAAFRPRIHPSPNCCELSGKWLNL